MQNLNEMLLTVFNASATPPAMLVAFARMLAVWGVYAAALALVWAWVRSHAAARARLVTVGLTIAIALMFNMSIATAWFHARPFAVGVGHQWLAHSADSSFPSDHASVVFAVAFGLMVARAKVIWSVVALLLAFGVAWSRVYLGVHWPFDMAGSFIVALGASVLARAVMATTSAQRLRHLALALYDWLLDVLHIPAGVSSRSFGAK